MSNNRPQVNLAPSEDPLVQQLLADQAKLKNEVDFWRGRAMSAESKLHWVGVALRGGAAWEEQDGR